MNNYFSILIPNYNGMKYLKVCLDSIRGQTFKNYEIVIMDDASNDGSVEFLKHNYPEVKISQLERNSAFSKVVNAGIKRCQGDYIFLLNNDTRMENNCLEEIIKAIRQNPAFDIYACKILSIFNPAKIDSAGEGYSLIGSPYKIGFKQNDGPQYRSAGPVFGACAAASVYKRELFKDIGDFDEDFVYYGEDTDLHFRSILRGHRAFFVPSAIVYHYLLGTSRQNMARVIFHISRNKINIIVKNMPTQLVIKYFPLFIIGRLKDLFKALLSGHFLAGVFGVLAAVKQFPVMMKKRKTIQKSRVITNKELAAYFNLKII